MTIQVSVVVPTCNRPELLNRCLAALVEQTFDPSAYEIIVVDDAASAATQRLVDDWAEGTGNVLGGHKGSPALRYIPVTDVHGPAAARNLGWRSAIGEIIAFTDDDCIPDRQWLSAGVAMFRPEVIGVSGRLIVPLITVPTDYERNAAELERAAFATANCFYRRDAIAGINGFDQRFTIPWREDSDLLFMLLKQLGIDGQSEQKRAAQLTQFPFIPGQGWTTQFDPEQHYNPKLIYAPDAIVVHPIRPAPWGISLSQQRKSFFNALLYKKHPELYRQWLPPVTPWHYYGIVTALIVSLVALLIMGLQGANQMLIGVAIAASLIWLMLTTKFCWQRLQGTSHELSHIAEMAITSILIPPLSLFWRLLGGIRFRVLFF
jgi:glycosyltransferase involved in cell wall biosynthesis